jgi:hypothetical protein
MKLYNQFIDEKLGDKFIKKDLYTHFIFRIDIRLESMNNPNEFEKYKEKAFDIFNKYKNFNWEKHNLYKNSYACEVDLIKIKNINKIYNIDISFIAGAYETIENQITLEEFLKIDIDDIEEYFEIKNNIKKYNL